MIAEIQRPACPRSLAFYAAHLGMRYEGAMESFGDISALWLFTDLDPQSPALHATISVEENCTVLKFIAAINAKRDAFAAALA